MANGPGSAFDPASRKAHLPAVKQTQETVNGPDPTFGPAGPAHGFRPGKRINGFRQNFRQQVNALRTLLLDHREVERPLPGLADFRLVPGDAVAAQETLHRPVGRIGAGSPAFLGNIRGFCRQAVDHQREAARRREYPGGIERQPRLLEAAGHQPLQVLGGPGLHAGGNFLGQDFQEKFRHLDYPAPKYCSQHALARLRTLPM